MTSTLDPHAAAQAMEAATALWHNGPTAGSGLDSGISPPAGDCDLDTMLLRLHRANFDLWHEEDKARDPAATDAQIAAVKRNIDRLNQSRNDLMEQCDRLLLACLESAPVETAPLHSETPGMMLDRLSILSLKIYHTRVEADRSAAPTGHRQRNQERLLVLQAQRQDLADCLAGLWAEVRHGTRRFKLYRQLKMYNDPSLNPAIYHGNAQ